MTRNIILGRALSSFKREGQADRSLVSYQTTQWQRVTNPSQWVKIYNQGSVHNCL